MWLFFLCCSTKLVCDNLIRASFDQNCVFPDVAACQGRDRADISVFLDCEVVGFKPSVLPEGCEWVMSLPSNITANEPSSKAVVLESGHAIRMFFSVTFLVVVFLFCFVFFYLSISASLAVIIANKSSKLNGKTCHQPVPSRTTHTSLF